MLVFEKIEAENWGFVQFCKKNRQCYKIFAADILRRKLLRSGSI